MGWARFCGTPAAFPCARSHRGELEPAGRGTPGPQRPASRPGFHRIVSPSQQLVGHIAVSREWQRPGGGTSFNLREPAGGGSDGPRISQMSAEAGLEVAWCLLILNPLLFQDGVYFRIKEGSRQNRFGLATGNAKHSGDYLLFKIYYLPI